MRACTIVLALCSLLICSLGASAAVVTLPDTSQSTTFTATVSEQADVTVPAGVAFNVTDVSDFTDAAAASVSLTNIVLGDGKAVRLELKSNAEYFTPPTGGTDTWSACDIWWNAATWTNGTGYASEDELNSSSFTLVAESNANASPMETSNLLFKLHPRTTCDRAGDHTLNATWKSSSF